MDGAAGDRSTAAVDAAGAVDGGGAGEARERGGVTTARDASTDRGGDHPIAGRVVVPHGSTHGTAREAGRGVLGGGGIVTDVGFRRIVALGVVDTDPLTASAHTAA